MQVATDQCLKKVSRSLGTYFPCFSNSPRVSFLSSFIHKMHETGLLLYTSDSVKTKTRALQHFKEFPDGFLKQPYNTCMCSNHTALAWAAITHHLLVLQLYSTHMCTNHTLLAWAAVIHLLYFTLILFKSSSVRHTSSCRVVP